MLAVGIWGQHKSMISAPERRGWAGLKYLKGGGEAGLEYLEGGVSRVGVPGRRGEQGWSI